MMGKIHLMLQNQMLLNYKFKEFQKKLIKMLSMYEKADLTAIMESQYGNYKKFIKLFDDLSKQLLQDFTPYNVLIEELNLYFNQ